jgi:radical SAM superfamily enzyme YgiQ (UPF0313 family)
MPPLYARFERAELVLELDERLKLRVDVLGRWSSYRDEHGLYRRLLSGGVVSQGRRVVDVDDVAVVYARVTRAIATLSDAVRKAPEVHTSGRAAPSDDSTRERAEEWLARAATWNETRYAEQAELFRRAYPEPVPILPPDRSRDLVVLPALGCPYGRCRFCAFYGEPTYRALTREQFSDHLDRVTHLLGPSVDDRSGIFLGSANALALGRTRLTSALAEVRRRFGTRRVSSFWDPDHSPERDDRAFAELVEGGLESVYVGLETGSPTLRAELGKSGDLTAFERRVRLARLSGLRIGVSVLAGVADPASEHEPSTARAIRGLDLGPNDMVFVSPLLGVATAAESAEALTRTLSRATPARVASYAPDRHRYVS